MKTLMTAVAALALMTGAAHAERTWGHGGGERRDDGQGARHDGGRAHGQDQARQPSVQGGPQGPSGGPQLGARGGWRGGPGHGAQAQGQAQAQGDGGQWRRAARGGWNGGERSVQSAQSGERRWGSNPGEGRWSGGDRRDGDRDGRERWSGQDRRWDGDRRDRGAWNGGDRDGRRWGDRTWDHPQRSRDRGRNWFDPDRYRRSYYASHRYHVRPYVYPRGWYYNRWSFGDYLPFGWFNSSYYLDSWAYGLPPAPIGCEWVRVGDDAYLVDIWTGEILSVYYDLFW